MLAYCSLHSVENSFYAVFIKCFSYRLVFSKNTLEVCFGSAFTFVNVAGSFA